MQFFVSGLLAYQHSSSKSRFHLLSVLLSVLKEVTAVNFHCIQSQLPSKHQRLYEDVVIGDERHVQKLSTFLLIIFLVQISRLVWWNIINSCVQRCVRVIGAVWVVGQTLNVRGWNDRLRLSLRAQPGWRRHTQDWFSRFTVLLG